MRRIALLIMISIVSTSFSMKEGFVWRPKKKQQIAVEREKQEVTKDKEEESIRVVDEKEQQAKIVKEKSIRVNDRVLDILESISLLSQGLSHQNTPNIIVDIVFNLYKNNPNDIVELLAVANDLMLDTYDKELGNALKLGCINFIANTALRMSDIGSVSDKPYYGTNSWGQQLNVPTLYSIYRELVNHKSRLFNSDDEINFAKPYLNEQTRKACVWLDSLRLLPEDSELVASTLFEENLNERSAAAYYKGHHIPCLALNVVRYSHVNKYIALGSDNGVMITKGDKTLQIGLGNVTDLCFSPDDELIIAAYKDRSCIKLYQMYKTYQEDIKLAKERSYRAYLLQKKYISSIPLSFLEKNNISSDVKRMFQGNIPYMRDEEIAQVALSGHTAKVLSLDMHSDGKRALSGGEDKTVRLWDIKNQSAETRILQDKVSHVGFSLVDKNVFLTASKAAKVWDIRSKSPILELSDEAITIDQSPDGTQLLIAGNIGGATWDKPKKNGVKIYDIRSAKSVQEYYLNYTVKAARFSPKSSEKFFTRYYNGNVQFWVVDGDEQYVKMDRRNLNPGDFRTTACSYSNDGNNFAKVGYFSLFSCRNPESLSQGSCLIERRLSDSSKRKLGKGFNAKRALETRFNEAVMEQAQSVYKPKDY